MKGKLIIGLMIPLSCVLSAQANLEKSAANLVPQETGLPLKRLALFSSGVGYFEHQGDVSGTGDAPAEIPLTFSTGAVNDALKSLTIIDPVSSSPSVHYPSEETLYRTLRSLSIDLSGNPGLPDILNSLRGEEVEVSVPNPVTGRIVGVVYQQRGFNSLGNPVNEPRLTLFTPQGLQSMALGDVSAFSFKDDRINRDFTRALDLLRSSRNNDTRSLLVSLPGQGKRSVTLSYVIPAPVWKVSYRLDLSPREPFFQGWAIVDNDSDIDWRNVHLSLVTGRPVSFIQNLYPPYRTSRPVLPLAIAGVAEGRTYDTAYDEAAVEAEAAVNFSAARAPVPAPAPKLMAPRAPMADLAEMPQAVGGGAALQTAAGSAAGDQFEFTIPRPVTLERRQSAMLPLVEGTVTARKTLVLSGSRIPGNGSINPAVSAEITNTTGMKLPAGPITVYDGGTYAGDALINFLSEGEKRIISYGEDLSVTGSAGSTSSRVVSGVTISGGVMVISRRAIYERAYTVRNASGESKHLIIEHPITQGAALTDPEAYTERTTTLYRFSRDLRGNETLTFTVREEAPLSERIILANLPPASLAAYITNQEIPPTVRSALEGAVSLKKTADQAAAAQQDLENRKNRLTAEQDRIRKNLEAAGNQTPQGQEYLKRLIALDGDIDQINQQIDGATEETDRAKRAYDDYLASLRL